ncbi:MAG: hypothetical protein CL843_19260 [Crocinitomicaceae bacterium]|nr:hypothetical protein [Crocinitomicaceae bacterium]|tara:strand:- start:101 stop:1090 length:990 start_codon:yes stop_codon:yes gene_type:complete
MKATITTENIKEVIHERTYPENFRSDCGVSSHQISIDLGRASAGIKEMHFDGIIVLHGNYRFKDRLQVKGGFDEPIVEMHYNLKGSTYGKVKDFKRPVKLNEREHNIIYMNEPVGSFTFQENSEVESVEVSFTQSYFQRFADYQHPIVDQFLESIEKQEPINCSKNGKLNLQMECVLREITCNPFKGFTQRLMLEARILELFSMQLEELSIASYSLSRHVRISAYEKQQLEMAAQEIKANLDHPLTIQELSKKVGMNEFKLKKMFKLYFGTTTFRYLTDYRLNIAKQYLLDTSISVAEIADKIGYAHQQHFTTAFKRKYGVTPKRIRNK